MADVLYALEKLGSGLSILAGHPGRIRERMQDAYIGQMMRTPTSGAGIPEEVGRSIAALHDRMASTEAVADEGRIAATVAKMTEDEAQEIVQEIERIYYELLDHHRQVGH
jgi:hypothetical protein